ncbi:MAG: hypothetical protein M1427_04795 [Candidatus Thermoplasmatota archaeon]|nr:hypothetical protein [Candidatus Thermoplasmatota archaeon]
MGRHRDSWDKHDPQGNPYIQRIGEKKIKKSSVLSAIMRSRINTSYSSNSSYAFRSPETPKMGLMFPLFIMSIVTMPHSVPLYMIVSGSPFLE